MNRKKQGISKNIDYDENKFNNHVNELYRSSFFKNQILDIKKNLHEENRNYQFLNIQHRFNENIMQITNCFYEDEKSLIMPEKINQNKIYSKLDFCYKKQFGKKDSVIMVDTTFFDEGFLDKIKKTNY